MINWNITSDWTVRECTLTTNAQAIKEMAEYISENMGCGSQGIGSRTFSIPTSENGTLDGHREGRRYHITDISFAGAYGGNGLCALGRLLPKTRGVLRVGWKVRLDNDAPAWICVRDGKIRANAAAREAMGLDEKGEED